MKTRIIELPKFTDPRGNLSFVEELVQIPFKIERTFWICDVPGGEQRGGHAYKNQEELIIAISGSFDVCVDNGTDQTKYSLNRSYKGLYVPSGIWRSLENFSTNSLALIICSTQFNESDYLRDYQDFKDFIK